MSRYASDTYKLLVLDVAEIKLFIKLCDSGKLPIDLIKDKIDDKIQKVIDIKFKMARGIVKRIEEREVQKLFKRLVHIKDEALTVPRTDARDSVRSLCNFIDNVHLNSTRN